jgi:hypothetical protein
VFALPVLILVTVTLYSFLEHQSSTRCAMRHSCCRVINHDCADSQGVSQRQLALIDALPVHPYIPLYSATPRETRQ